MQLGQLTISDLKLSQFAYQCSVNNFAYTYSNLNCVSSSPIQMVNQNIFMKKKCVPIQHVREQYLI